LFGNLGRNTRRRRWPLHTKPDDDIEMQRLAVTAIDHLEMEITNDDPQSAIKT
jgi:hypothetical protein